MNSESIILEAFGRKAGWQRMLYIYDLEPDCCPLCQQNGSHPAVRPCLGIVLLRAFQHDDSSGPAVDISGSAVDMSPTQSA